MTPDQCTVVREHLNGWTLADALCGDREARTRLVQMMCGSSRVGRESDRGVRWAELTRRGIEARHMYERTAEVVATWAELRGHLDSVPGGIGHRAHAAYAEYQRLRADVGRAATQRRAAAGTCQRGLAAVIEADAYATAHEHLRDVLTPLLDRALTWTPPVIATQPDIFDLLAEVA